mgnify:CR=1 FL=1
MDVDIPVAVMQRFGLVAKKQGKEHHSPCPECGGNDRLTWFGDGKGNGFCRNCLKTFWLTEAQELDPLEKLEQLAKEREIREREQSLMQARLTDWQSKAAAYRKGWHDAMSYAAREWWRKQGITHK